MQAMWKRICASPGADFLVQPDTTFGFGALERAIRQWLAAFDAHGLQPGDRIVVRTRSEEAQISLFLAALLDGVVPVLLSGDTPVLRMAALSEAVDARLLVVDADWGDLERLPTIARIALTRSGAPAPRTRLWRRQAAMLPHLLIEPATRTPRLPETPSGLAYILFTSGTTASPAGVCISRGNLLANLATLTRLYGYDAHSRIFNDMILAHADGMIQGPVLAAFNGCAVIRSGGFQLNRMEGWLERVRATRSTHVLTVPTIWSMIDAYARHDDYFDAPECRSLLSVAAKLPEDLWQRIENRFKRPLFNLYGLTETVTTALYAGPHPEMGGFGTIGKPVDCEARIDPAAASPDEGELQLRGENIFSGYWNDAERTAASFTADGWLKTGDLARRRDDGSFVVLGRLKAVIMSGGFLIRPDEIDEAMLRHPHVLESATVAMADATFDEIPVTAVVGDRPLDETALTAHARAHLEPQKVPKRIVAVAAIPRGDSGKAKLSAVRAMLEETLSGGADANTLASDTPSAILATAADVFRVDPALLSLQTAQGDVAGWDSFSQIALLLAIEDALDVRIPASRVAAVRTLGDIASAVEALRQ
jgi:long-chain acyl-CoA synthetase